MSLDGVWSNDSTTFYLREQSSEVWWLAESKDGKRTHVFRGSVLASQPPEPGSPPIHPLIVEGDWADIPKSNAKKKGHIKVRSFSGSDMTVIAQSGDAYGLTEWKHTGQSHVSSAAHPELFADRDASYVDTSLTGHWQGFGNGNNYYVRQIGSTVWWMGEHAGGDGYCHVFNGTFDAKNNFLSGDWVNVPKGPHSFYGEVGFDIWLQGRGPTPQNIRRKSTFEAVFGDHQLVRADANTALGVNLAYLKCIQTTPGGADDVYLLLAAVDLASATPRMEVQMTPVTTMDDGDDYLDDTLFWGLAKQGGTLLGEPIRKAQDAVLLVGAAENDGASVETTRSAARAMMLAALVALKADGADREAIVSGLANAMQGAINMKQEIPLVSDFLIDVDQIPLSSSDLRSAWRGDDVKKGTELGGSGSGKGHYHADFRLFRNLVT